MNILTLIEIVFPDSDSEFYESLEAFLGELYKSQSNIFPKLNIVEEEVTTPVVRFYSKEDLVKEVRLENDTGIEKESTYSYSHLELGEIIRRLDQPVVDGIDHFGFNLPWFEDGIHPNIVELRNILKEKSLYHLYPSGESWDFILSGTLEEISGDSPFDYSQDKRPKFEIVSFDGASTPMVQLEVNINKPFEEMSELFPEGIAIEELHDVWLYVDNPYGIDICIVLNQAGDDWSHIFEGQRL